MAARRERGSPTEVIEDESDEDLKQEDGEGPPVSAMHVDGTGGSPARMKRARDQAENASTTLRREMSPGDERPVTSREFRNLLQEHLQTMTHAWQEMHGRVAKVEGEQVASKQEKDIMYARIAQTERKQADSVSRIDKMEKDIAELRAGGLVAKDGSVKPMPSDPWMAYRAQNGPLSPKTGVANTGGPGVAPVPDGTTGGREPGGRDELSDEDRRTLVLGGWLQDSKRQVILDEGGAFLRRDDIKPFVDVQELTVYGPRRSFGLLRFKPRAAEEPKDVRDRMWKVIQCLRAQPHRLTSTVQGGSEMGRPMWAQFVKTREARRRSAHGSLLRRVCLGLVKDAIHNQEAHNPGAVEEGAYDVDWGSGTVWLSEWKIGSSTHRPPTGDDVKLLSTGWVDIGAVSKALGVTWDLALQAFQREI